MASHTVSTETTQPPPRTRRRWPVLAALILLVASVAVLGVLLGYSTRSAKGWQTEAERRSATLGEVTAERDALAGQLESAKSELADVTAKYTASAARIRSLADEKAQAGDRAAWLAQVASLSRQVTTRLDACVTDLQTLQGYLVNAAAYDPESLSAYATKVNAQCDKALADSSALSQLLGAP